MNIQNKKGLIEAILLLKSEPVSVKYISSKINIPKEKVVTLIKELNDEYSKKKSGYHIYEDSKGNYFLTVNKKYFKQLEEKLGINLKKRLSYNMIETLSIIAYKQPITRKEIEIIKGSKLDGTLKKLMEYNLIKVVGRKASPGAPPLYGTTKEFLSLFRLRSLKDLPAIRIEEEENNG